MNERFDDLMNSVFKTNKTLNKTDKNKQNTTTLISELEDMSKQMDDFLKQNSSLKKTTINTKTTTNKIINPEIKTTTNKKIDFNNIETKLKSIVIGQDEMIHQLIIGFKRASIAGNSVGKIKNKILIAGPLSNEKTAILNKLNELLFLESYIAHNKIYILDLKLYPSINEEKLFIQDLYSLLTNKNAIIVFKNIEKCSTHYIKLIKEFLETGKIILNERYILNNSQLVETKNTLSANTINCIEANEQYFIVVSDLNINELTKITGSQFIELFKDICITETLNDHEIIETIKQIKQDFITKCLVQLDYKIIESIPLENILIKNYNENLGTESIMQIFDELYEALVEFKLHTSNDTNQIIINNKLEFIINDQTYLPKQLLPVSINYELNDVIEELNHIIGLQSVKEYILSLKDHYQIQKIRNEQGLKTSSVSKHMIFTGNPGTGKTTIARIVAKYLKAIGILSSGQLVEVSRADLVGRYVGHTAPLTKKIIESAIGGVLFIDEAYSLYRGNDDSFGLECIDTLVKGIEDHRDNLVVILAGYTKEMNDFLESNSGLKSRFPNIIEFSNYTAQELYLITEDIARKNDYYLEKDCYEPLIQYYEYKQKIDAMHSGNGRLARNLIEEAMINQAKRLVVETNAPLNQLKILDFDLDK